MMSADGFEFAFGFGMGVFFCIFCGIPIWARMTKFYASRVEPLPSENDNEERSDLWPESNAPLKTSWGVGSEGIMENGVLSKDFAVTAKPRHIPWSRRKKELEAGARQKRRQREEWRDQ